MRRTVAGFVAASALGLCGTAFALAADPLSLTIPLPLTGGQAKFGEMMKRSYEMAAEEINSKGGVKGRMLTLSFDDSQAKPDSARAIVEKLIDVKKQPIIVGEYTSACAKAVAAVANERKTPYLIVASADDAITQQNYKYVFRQNVPNAYYAGGLVSFFRDDVKPQSIAILYESSDFGSSGATDMEKHAQKLGMKVLLKEKYEKGAVDFKPILSKVKQNAPDVIFMVSYVMDASLLMKQIKELRIDAKLFAGGAAGFALPEFVDNAKDAAEFVVTATLWTPQVKYRGAKEYADKYKAKYGDFPSYHGASAYSAMYVVQDVLTRARSMSTEDITASMKKTNLQTAYGFVKFDDRDGYQNQCFSETFVLQVQKGEHQTVWPSTWANKKALFPIPRWRDRK